MEGIFANPDRKKEFINDLTGDQRSTPDTAFPAEHQKTFLNHIKKYHLDISLYKANQDNTGWEKLDLHPTNNNSIVSQNCN